MIAPGIMMFRRAAEAIWAFGRKHIRIQTGHAGRSLTAGSIVWRFAQDTLLTGAIFLILVGATHVLRATASTMKDSPVHYQPLETLEHGIFYSGCFMLGLVALFVTVVSAVDLARWFIGALRHAANSGSTSDDA